MPIFYDTQLRRFVRFAEQQERMIGPDGTYPPVGRSIAYRLGAFHALAQVSLMKKLPKEIKPAQVRCALTKAMKRQLVKGTYDKDGWLTLGVLWSSASFGGEVCFYRKFVYVHFSFFCL